MFHARASSKKRGGGFASSETALRQRGFPPDGANCCHEARFGLLLPWVSVSDGVLRTVFRAVGRYTLRSLQGGAHRRYCRARPRQRPTSRSLYVAWSETSFITPR